MDIVTDLAAEAVSYLTVIQDICKSSLPAENREGPEAAFIWDAFANIGTPSGQLMKLHEARISELVWSSKGACNPEQKEQFFLSVADALLIWLKKVFEVYNETQNISELQQARQPGIWTTPDYWRRQLKEILYGQPEERQWLVSAIHYMPVQIIYAMSAKRPGIYKQRLYQFYFEEEKNDNIAKDNKTEPEEMLSKSDLKVAHGFWNDRTRIKAMAILIDDKALLHRLNEREIAIPFETHFRQELDEIDSSRNSRIKELSSEDIAKFPAPIPAMSDNNNPQHRADEMELAGLAFSGGGIRSATFNLGVLQKLAELGALPRFDYLSTVSGGGYIGTWLNSWILRDGSIKKVNDRLNKQQSTDPLAEEVRPIRWLRMFSNYLSPNVSIMSTDSWTMGVTWLRNTLINQVILLLLLLTVLSTINAFFDAWVYLGNFDVQLTSGNILFWGCILFGIGSFLAASGMRAYDRSHPPQSKFNLGKSAILAHFMISWAVAASFLITLWFFTSNDATGEYLEKIKILFPGFYPCFAGMLFIAFKGGYHRYSEKKMLRSKIFTVRLVTAIVFSTFFAALSGVALLAASWHLIQYMANTYGPIPDFQAKLVLVFGVPLILESVCITVVVRMALMGSFFPDERREWWGRMGALIHRFMLWWILTSVAALMVPPFYEKVNFKSIAGGLPTLLGGWMAIIGFAVKLAFQSKNPGNKPDGTAEIAQEVFIRVAPYLFMVGFLLIGAYILKLLDNRILDLLIDSLEPWAYVICTVILAIITFLLSWRVGVNDFSLHDFYRNRLVRAYMGGTRRRTDRENTANNFTGFDMDDDFPMALMRADQNYTGPFPLINTTLNSTIVSELDRQDRMAESFVFTPLYCGFDFTPTRSSAYTRNQVFEYGYRPTENYSRPTGPLLGTAMAISGAAVNPNMGYHSSAATAFLLTIFNVRLGRWLGNPRKNTWKRSDPISGLGYLVKDLIGKSDIDSDYICLSDGGHFDNMGLYELIRRRCKYIVLGDAEEDEGAVCEGLANAIRRCRIDFGVEIVLDVTSITKKDKDTQFSLVHLVKGSINYPGATSPGKIIYIKTSLTGDEDVDIREYFLNNPEFPQQSTGDQFFDESQFESYRKLGYHSIKDKDDLNPFVQQKQTEISSASSGSVPVKRSPVKTKRGI